MTRVNLSPGNDLKGIRYTTNPIKSAGQSGSGLPSFAVCTGHGFWAASALTPKHSPHGCSYD